MATVDIIIPVYNRPALVREAIESALNAAPDVSLEIIVVDDASTDGTWDSLRAYDDPRVRCFRMESNSGQNVARNRGLDVAHGTWIKFLDSDDVWLPDRIAHQLPTLESSPRAVGLCGVTHFLEPGFEHPPWLRQGALDGAAPGHLPSCWMAHRSVIDAIGRFDETYRVGEDTEWRARGLALGIGDAYVDEVLVRRRIHGANLSGHVTETRQNLFRLLRPRVARPAEPSP